MFPLASISVGALRLKAPTVFHLHNPWLSQKSPRRIKDRPRQIVGFALIDFGWIFTFEDLNLILDPST